MLGSRFHMMPQNGSIPLQGANSCNCEWGMRNRVDNQSKSKKARVGMDYETGSGFA